MSNDGSGFDNDVEWPDFDNDGVDTEKLGSTLKVNKKGIYHFNIVDAKPRMDRVGDNGKERFPDILVTCEVLESVPGQSGKGSLYYHELRVAGKGGSAPEDWIRVALCNFLTGLGILVVKDDKVIDPETGTTKVNIQTLAARIKAVGQFIGDIKQNKSDDPNFDDKYELSFGRGAFRVDDPAVESVPKNVAALKLIGKAPAAAPAKAGGGKKNGAKAEAPAAVTSPPDDLSGL